MQKYITVKQMKEIANKLDDNNRLVANTLGNISIFDQNNNYFLIAIREAITHEA